MDGNSPNDGRAETDPRDQEQRAPAKSNDPGDPQVAASVKEPGAAGQSDPDVRTDSSDDSNQRQDATGGEGSSDSRASGRGRGGRSRQGQGRNSRQGRGGQRNRGGRGRRRQRGPEGGGDRQSNSRQDDGRNDDVELASPDDSSVELLGILEVLGSGSGFIRRRDAGYTPSNEDIYVGAKVIQKFGLRTGDELTGSVGPKPKSGKSPPLTHLALVNAKPPDDAKRRPDFNRLSAVHPNDQLVLACDRMIGGQPDYTNRVIDLFCPLGKGQRAMIVAPSKAGKTTVLQSVAEGIVTNHPECRLMILLADERPEEITDMEMCGFGEVIASSFDRPAERHCQVAEMTLEPGAALRGKRGGRRDHPRLHHTPGSGVQYGRRRKWTYVVGWSGRELPRKAPSGSSGARERSTLGRVGVRSRSWPPHSWIRGRAWTRSSSRSSRGLGTANWC